MSEQWTPLRKAVIPDDEAPQPTPTGETLPPHDEERMGIESHFYAWLIDRGWTSDGGAECTIHDTWTHRFSSHSGRRGHELWGLLGFDPDQVFRQLTPAPKPPLDIENARLARLIRRARGE